MIRGFLDSFMRRFERRVDSAVRRIDAMNLGVRDLSARIEGRWIRLSGVAPSREVAARVIEHFRQLVEVDNILDTIRVVRPGTGG
jgi:hypothetical protein